MRWRTKHRPRTDERGDFLYSGACPSWFRASVKEASARHFTNYYMLARTLARSARGMVEQDLDGKRWTQAEREIKRLCDRRDVAGTILWLKKYLPRCMELVPDRRVGDSFAAGIEAALIEGEFEL